MVPTWWNQLVTPTESGGEKSLTMDVVKEEYNFHHCAFIYPLSICLKH